MPNKVITTIGIDADIVQDKKFQELKNKRQLSTHISNMLRTTLNIQKEEISEDEKKIKEELQRIQFRQVILQEKLDELESKKPKLTEAERREGWFILDGQKVKRG